MIRTKKILALFLAVVLMFSALPFSVSADEIESMMETDGPVLYAQDPFNTVKSEVEGGTSYMTSVGVTRESIVRELEAHEHDSYYLGTKYVGGDAQSPNGDTSYGDYQVAELEAAPGYVTMKETIAVEVNKTDVDLEDIANSQTVVHFSKVDKETGEELPGAVLELYAPDGSLLDTWETTDIPHVIPGLPVGEGYVLREVSAPEGYEVSEDVTFEVTDTTEIQTITMEDVPTPEEPDQPVTPDEPDEPTPEIPQTGESPAVFWIGGLLILALLGLCVTIPLLRHCNKQ